MGGGRKNNIHSRCFCRIFGRCCSSSGKKPNTSAIDDSPYNALLDVYEPGSTIAGLQPMFAALKARLIPLLKRITAELAFRSMTVFCTIL